MLLLLLHQQNQVPGWHSPRHVYSQQQQQEEEETVWLLVRPLPLPGVLAVPRH